MVRSVACVFNRLSPRCDDSEDAEGDIDAMSLWAGQSVGLVSKFQSARTIVREIADEAEWILRRLAQ